jgi:hypothetical protein
VPVSTFDPSTIGWYASYSADAILAADGSLVAQWNDTSGNARHLTQATSASQPTYRSSVSVLNGKPAVEFDGVDDFIRSAALTLAQPFGIVVVFAGAGTSGEVLLGRYSGAGQAPILRNLTGAWSMFAGSNLSSGSANSSAHLLMSAFNGATSALYADGAAGVTGNAGTNTSSGIRLGNDFNSTGALSGHIAYAAIKASALTTQERSDLLGWAQYFYGTP